MSIEFDRDGKRWVLTAEHVDDNADNRDADGIRDELEATKAQLHNRIESNRDALDAERQAHALRLEAVRKEHERVYGLAQKEIARLQRLTESLRKPLEGEFAKDVGLVVSRLRFRLCSDEKNLADAFDRITAALRAKGEPHAVEPMVKCDCAFADNPDRLHHELACPAAEPPEPTAVISPETLANAQAEAAQLGYVPAPAGWYSCTACGGVADRFAGATISDTGHVCGGLRRCAKCFKEAEPPQPRAIHPECAIGAHHSTMVCANCSRLFREQEPRPIVVGSKVRCSFDNGTVDATVVRVDDSKIPYLVEYYEMKPVSHKTWADAKSVTWVSDPPATTAPELPRLTQEDAQRIGREVHADVAEVRAEAERVKSDEQIEALVRQRNLIQMRQDALRGELEAVRKELANEREAITRCTNALRAETAKSNSLKSELTQANEQLEEARKELVESLRKPLEGELARELETVRESLLEYVGTPNSAELHALDAIEAELARALSKPKPVAVAGYSGVHAEFCGACSNVPCTCARPHSAASSPPKAIGSHDGASATCPRASSTLDLSAVAARGPDDRQAPELTDVAHELSHSALATNADSIARAWKAEHPEPRAIISDDDCESLTSPLSIADPPNDDLRGCDDSGCAKAQIHRGPCEPRAIVACQWHSEEESVDGTFTYGPDCGAPAEYISCQPYSRTPTCAAHKCRCAKPRPAPELPRSEVVHWDTREEDAPRKVEWCECEELGQSVAMPCASGCPTRKAREAREDAAKKLPRKVEPGTALTVGARYRITEIASWDRRPPDHLGKEFTCDNSDGWRGSTTRPAWLVAAGTYVTGLELVAEPGEGE